MWTINVENISHAPLTCYRVSQTKHPVTNQDVHRHPVVFVPLQDKYYWVPKHRHFGSPWKFTRLSSWLAWVRETSYIGYNSRGNSPYWRHQSFSFPGSEVLLIWLRLLAMSCWSCSSCWESALYHLSSALYHRPRLLMNFPSTVGIGSMLMWNRC